MKKTAYHSKFNYDFIKGFPIFGGLSAILVVASIILIFTKGFNYGIEFVGGTEMEVRFAGDVNVGDLRKHIDDLGFKNTQVQSFGETKEYLIRFENVQGATDKETNQILTETIQKVTESLKTKFESQGPEIRRVDTVGPQVGEQLKRNSVLAGVYSLLLILIYIGMRFDYKYAPGAVLCLFHDAVVTLGVLVLLGREVNIQVLAAILTLIGFSLNDTIVTFDRVRENESILGDTDKFIKILNRSVNETLGRTLITSLTTFLSVLALYIFGKGVIKDFAFAMAIGVLFGAYSTIFVASPLVLMYEKYVLKRATS